MARRRRLDEDQRQLWQEYREVFQGLSATLQEQLVRDAGLSGSEYAVLVALSYAPDGVLRVRDLGAELGWDRSRLSHLVRRMEQRGLVVREECLEDARGSMVRLTTAGQGAVDDAAPEHSEAIRRYFFDPLTKDDLATLSTILGRLRANLQRDPTDVGRGTAR